jgi:hypothetical protein
MRVYLDPTGAQSGGNGKVTLTPSGLHMPDGSFLRPDSVLARLPNPSAPGNGAAPTGSGPAGRAARVRAVLRRAEAASARADAALAAGDLARYQRAVKALQRAVGEACRLVAASDVP